MMVGKPVMLYLDLKTSFSLAVASTCAWGGIVIKEGWWGPIRLDLWWRGPGTPCSASHKP